ncbi:MAG TPA: MBL fold metallo-hydrolase [Actinomycetota bacterium]|nr:MBL fold metallo-hydrolase [Actinomycetota bacterium]
MRTISLTPEITVLQSATEIPMLGVLPVNSFLIKGDEPILIDTGMTPDKEEFLATLGSLIDPADLRWIWLTHADRDHTGAISELLELAPNARVATAFITLGLMLAGNQPIPPERAYLVRTGTVVEAGSRSLEAIRPPLFDNPGTVGFYDRTSGVLFSSDFLGGVMPSMDHAYADDITEVPDSDVATGQLLWGSVDAPWVHNADEAKFGRDIDMVRACDPKIVLSTHLPPIRGNVDAHLKTVSKLPSSAPTMLPDQAVLEAAMSEIAHGEG